MKNRSKFIFLDLTRFLGTLKNWEQKRRKPDGPARVLLGFVALHPEVLLDVVGT
jgi:DNA-binding transcriptional regulator YiaG